MVELCARIISRDEARVICANERRTPRGKACGVGKEGAPRMATARFEGGRRARGEVVRRPTRVGYSASPATSLLDSTMKMSTPTEMTPSTIMASGNVGA